MGGQPETGHLYDARCPGVEMNYADLAFISLGSNLGDSAGIVRSAFKALQPLSAAPLLTSSLWRSAPVDCPTGSSDFVNAVAAIAPRTGETPESLLHQLQKIERELGRQPKRVLNEPRILDLDLISFRSETRQTEALTLPHPRSYERRFVLEPLAELAPDLIFPGQSRTVSELLVPLRSTQCAERIGP